jgi:hypothetical protein
VKAGLDILFTLREEIPQWLEEAQEQPEKSATEQTKPIFPRVTPQRWPARPRPRLWRTSEPLRVLAQHPLQRAEAGRQTEALE